MTESEIEQQKALQEAFKGKRIGLALSGGGHRAAVFHLGVLSYLAENKLLENVNHISTVSGGSILMGLIYKLNGYRFPTSDEYLNNIQPIIKNYFTKRSLTKLLLLAMIKNKKIVDRHSVLSSELKDSWGIHGNIQDIADTPIWTINTTVLETGKSWQIRKKEMKEYQLGGTSNPDIAISDAISASAGFPLGVGPMKLDIQKYKFKSSKLDNSKFLHLYDGGLYDNLGLEVFMKNTFSKLDKSIDFVMVCDASKPLEILNHRWYHKRIFRIIDISTEQIRSLKIRLFHKFLHSNHDKGIHIRIGDKQFKMDDNANIAKKYGTNFHKVAIEDFRAIKKNGYNTTLSAFNEYLKRIEEYK